MLLPGVWVCLAKNVLVKIQLKLKRRKCRVCLCAFVCMSAGNAIEMKRKETSSFSRGYLRKIALVFGLKYEMMRGNSLQLNRYKSLKIYRKCAWSVFRFTQTTEKLTKKECEKDQHTKYIHISWVLHVHLYRLCVYAYICWLFPFFFFTFSLISSSHCHRNGFVFYKRSVRQCKA